jgi:retinol-binding protein 3
MHTDPWSFGTRRVPLQPFRLIAFLLTALAIQAAAQAQPDSGPPIDRKTQAAIIDSVSAVLREEYVFPDVARKMEEFLRKNLKDGKYTEITDPAAFVERLGEDLRSVSHDKHLQIQHFSPGAMGGDTTLSPLQQRTRNLERLRAQNFGFRKVEILPGNIGYLDFRFFANAGEGGPTAIAAMNFLAHTDALIFDLRQNGGGNPSMIQLISSYLFEESVHLNSFYIRKGDSTQQFWTQESVIGPKMTSVPVYVLTSSFTFSGAEEFAYNLKNLKRGTIIGEVTGGGAHPVNERVFRSLNVALNVPYGRAVNPVSGTNWEGAGVEPDLKVPADRALLVARTEAVKALIGKTEDASKKGRLQWLLDGLAVEAAAVTVPDSVLASCAGTYGPRSVRFENGTLYYRREGRPEFRLIPMGGDRFMVETLDYFRMQFRRDSSGKVTELVGQYDNGGTDANPRTR